MRDVGRRSGLVLVGRRAVVVVAAVLVCFPLVSAPARAEDPTPTPTVTVTETVTEAASPAEFVLAPSQFATLTATSESVAFIDEYGRNVIGAALCLVIFFLAFLTVRSFSR